MSAGPGPVKAPPPSLAPLREAEQRSRAVPVYKALKRDLVAGGPTGYGMSWVELTAEAGLFNIHETIDAVQWMRARGVRVVVRPGEFPGNPARVRLIEALPEAFEPTGP